jgi:predicted ribosomally synthesized peptide with SipW-like signal peptide
MTKPEERVLALCVGGVVCIAASNGGTTSQDLKTGYLLGATPRYQQFAILVGALTSAVVIGGTLMLFNSSQTIYSEKPEHFPKVPDAVLKQLTTPGAAAERKTIDGITLVRWDPDKSNPIRTATEPDAYWVEITEEKPEAKKEDEKPGVPEPKPVKVGRVRYLIDPHLPERKTEEYKGQSYHVWYAIQPDFEGNPIRLLVTDQGKVAIRVDRAIMGKLTERVRDDGTVETIERKFDAPKTQVMGLIINGVLKRDLNWSMVLIGAMIAVMLELCGIPSLAFAVGVYVNIRFSVPIFLGGLIRLVIDKLSARKRTAAPTDEVAAIAETETSPAVLLSSGYIAGGSLGGVLIAFLEFAPKTQKALDFEKAVPQDSLYQWGAPILAFAVLMAILLLVGSGKLLRSGGQNANSGP